MTETWIYVCSPNSLIDSRISSESFDALPIIPNLVRDARLSIDSALGITTASRLSYYCHSERLTLIQPSYFTANYKQGCSFQLHEMFSYYSSQICKNASL